MTKRMKTITLLMLGLLFFGGACGTAWADAAGPSVHEEALLALINQARQNPLAAAAAMGMDPEQILRDLPELEAILREGLPPVAFNGTLHQTAQAHMQDMFGNGYYSHDSLDGQGFDARIRNSGYPAVATGESLGMLAFANFIDPEEAVQRIFEFMYWDELNPGRTEKRNILNPDFDEAGVSIDTGVMNLGGIPWNVYLATCDFGAAMSVPEARLLSLINWARQNPLGAAAQMGMDPNKILADFPEWQEMLTQGLSPLAANGKLLKAARLHAGEMLANGYYSHVSLDGRTYADRIREAGYDALDAGEYIKIQCLGHDFTGDDAAIDRQVGAMFEYFLLRELSPGNASPRYILNPGLAEAGIGIMAGVSAELGGICGDNLLFMTADFGVRAEQH